VVRDGARACVCGLTVLYEQNALCYCCQALSGSDLGQCLDCQLALKAFALVSVRFESRNIKSGLFS